MAFILLPVSILSGCVKEKAPAVEKQPDDLGRYMQISENVDSRQDISMKKEEHTPKKVIQINDTKFSRISNRELELTWSDQGDAYIKKYMVKRRKTGETRWQTIGARVSDGKADGVEHSFVDTLRSEEHTSELQSQR